MSDVSFGLVLLLRFVRSLAELVEQDEQRDNVKQVEPSQRGRIWAVVVPGVATR